MPLEPLSPSTKSEASSSRVYRGIMRDIEEGRLVPGQVLAETTLASDYGVGRNAVREAMQSLHARGIIDLSRHRSPSIRRLDQDETFEILAVAGALAALAAQAAAHNFNGAQHAPLIASALEALTDADANDEPGMFSRARRHFYRVLLCIGGNRELLRLFPAISMHIIYAQYQSRQLRGIRMADYQAIMHAVARGDAQAAEKAGRDHVANVRGVIEQIHNAQQ